MLMAFDSGPATKRISVQYAQSASPHASRSIVVTVAAHAGVRVAAHAEIAASSVVTAARRGYRAAFLVARGTSSLNHARGSPATVIRPQRVSHTIGRRRPPPVPDEPGCRRAPSNGPEAVTAAIRRPATDYEWPCRASRPRGRLLWRPNSQRPSAPRKRPRPP